MCTRHKFITWSSLTHSTARVRVIQWKKWWLFGCSRAIFCNTNVNTGWLRNYECCLSVRREANMTGSISEVMKQSRNRTDISYIRMKSPILSRYCCSRISAWQVLVRVPDVFYQTKILDKPVIFTENKEIRICS